MKLVVGLGNPGLKYLKNLHNLGFMAVELLAEKHGVSFNKKGFKGVYGEKNIAGEKQQNIFENAVRYFQCK